ncbi:dephospho-CoA kinase [Bacillus alveayuensis]|jgi:dephospho-CoA kinase|uniref:dephospho-CoA kinase n=1 Tax=Aeribacillus alveayuensis TaxID=279215 RepID=UPI0005D11089|nr:dephospho-CoA kinase [Bacillus alveayuensis]
MSLIVGLTGGIASGKSTVANMMREFQIPIIDADQIARDVVAIGMPAYEQIVETFGEDILNEDKTINRKKLGSIVFHHEPKRVQLNKIVHPVVRQEMKRQQKEYVEKGEPIVVLDLPLLFESNLVHMVDKVIVVYVDESTQLKRLMKRNGLSREEALARIHAQMPLYEKVKKADAVIDNNGTIVETKDQLIHILSKWNVLSFT